MAAASRPALADSVRRNTRKGAATSRAHWVRPRCRDAPTGSATVHLSFVISARPILAAPRRTQDRCRAFPTASAAGGEPGTLVGGFPDARRSRDNDRGFMTEPAAPTAATLRQDDRSTPIDIGDALDLLARVVNDHGEEAGSIPFPEDSGRYWSYHYAMGGTPQCIVGCALALADVDIAQLRAMGDRPLRDLYLNGTLPVPLTLGAVIVLDAAQQSQDRGQCWSVALEAAAAAAVRFFDLLGSLPNLTHDLKPLAQPPPSGWQLSKSRE